MICGEKKKSKYSVFEEWKHKYSVNGHGMYKNVLIFMLFPGMLFNHSVMP